MPSTQRVGRSLLQSLAILTKSLLSVTKQKHPSNRYERLRIKEIKDHEHQTGRPGRLWRKAKETEEAKELDHELRDEQVRH